MKGINTFTLKLIAVISMLIDHIGAVLFPEIAIFRILGRLAFPIFAYVLVEGFIYTHDVWKYMMRLGIMAFLSEIPFDLAISGKVLEFGHQNVFFTMFLGILMLTLMLKARTLFRKIAVVFVLLLVSELLRTDYNSVGLLMIFLFYQFREQKAVKMLMVGIVNCVLIGYQQVYAVLALVPIAFHNRKQGPKIKAFFYLFYPLHLLVLYLIQFIF